MPLTKTEVARFRKELEILRAQILKTLEGTNAEVKTPDGATGYSQHQADQGTDDFDRAITLQLSDKEQHILKQIDRCFEKMEENSYGVCDLTNEEIPIKRLEAIPYATTTVKAQEMMEKGLI